MAEHTQNSISAHRPPGQGFCPVQAPTIILLVSLLAGLMALLCIPRKKTPRSRCPWWTSPSGSRGASPTEVENLVVINLEKKLWEMEGLEDLYSQARGRVCHRYRQVQGGEKTWRTSLFKVYSKVFSNEDQVPQGVTGWVWSSP